jgi:hypothetical protein
MQKYFTIFYLDCFAALAKTRGCARKDKTPALRLCEERSDVAVQNRGIGLLRCARKDEVGVNQYL